MYPKLAAFKRSLQEQGAAMRPLYFAKVDVLSCFDTIPQQRLVTMVESLFTLEAYQTGKHVEMRPLGRLQRLYGQHVNPMPMKRYVPHSGAAGKVAAFDKLVQDQLVKSKAHTVFVDTAVHQTETKDDLMHLLREHVERNLVKVGKKFYRQKRGIPQGSVLSSILCNFFYAEFERDVLGFALGPGSLLMRLVDDFCFVTADRQRAEQFVKVMHRQHADYGVSVKREKSLTNFDAMTEDGYRIRKCDDSAKFPYCGLLLDTRTLEVSKDSSRIRHLSKSGQPACSALTI
jgi:telomerase reverse transcriptase